jgi:hypothetical protein
MANSTTGDVWIVDTLGGTGNQLAPPGTDIVIWSINWSEITAQSVCELRDCGNRTIWRDCGNLTQCSRFAAFTKPLQADGLGVVALTSGKLYLQMG